MRRGRPAHPDILTPREWEVLALVREGLTNEGIAGRLGISESGARYHVSEILSKLGVGSREEAAAWRPEATGRRGLLAVAATGGLRERLAVALSSKLAVAALISVSVVSLAIAGVAGMKLFDAPAGVPSLGQQGSRTAGVCEAVLVIQCGGYVARSFSTIEEAAEVASFEPRLPAYIPEGFEPISVVHSRPERWDPARVRENCSTCDPRFVHNDQIGVYYRDDAGGWLVVGQGFPGGINWRGTAANVSDGRNYIPDDRRGLIQIEGRGEAYWSRSGPAFIWYRDSLGTPFPGTWEDRQLTLGWTVGLMGDGWEMGSDGAVSYGSPYSWSISTDVLSLEELIAIAASVSFD
jgi:DNA-binding CsgD family transcriptional regulator